jgi:hypothetical protein
MDDERVIATISVVGQHTRVVFCLVCHRAVSHGPHMHVTTREWETCGYCSEGCAISYLRSVGAELPPPPSGARFAGR